MISLSKVLYATWPLLFFEMTIILIWMFFQRQDDGIVIINRCELCGSSEHVILIAPPAHRSSSHANQGHVVKAWKGSREREAHNHRTLRASAVHLIILLLVAICNVS